MEIKQILGNTKGFFKRYKYAVIVLIAGLLLMLLPSGKKDTDLEKKIQTQNIPTAQSVETQLTKLLRQIHGVGDVQLLLTLENNGETIFQTDCETTVNQDSQDSNIKTVVINDADRNQTGLIRKYNTPIYRGAVVVCTGGDNPNVKVALIEASTVLLNVPSHKVSILKMEESV